MAIHRCLGWGRSAGTPGSLDQEFGYRGPTRVLDQENWGNMGFGSRFNQAQDIRELVWELPQLLVSTTRFLVRGFKLRCEGGERRCWGTRTCIGNGEVPSNIQHPYHREGWEVSSIQYRVDHSITADHTSSWDELLTEGWRPVLISADCHY